MVIVNICKEATFVKLQIVQSTISPNSRSEDEKHQFGMDWMQGNCAVWRMATGELRDPGDCEFPKIVCWILSADTHVCVSGEMIHNIHDNFKEPFD